MAVHATILAGGAGTRLWPRSRRSQPKHLLALQQGEAPLLRQTYERILPLVDDVYVVTERHQLEGILRVLPELDPDHVIAEPTARGTASALGLAAMTLADRDPDAVMLSLPADHVIGDSRRFRQTIRRVIRLASQSKQLVTGGYFWNLAMFSWRVQTLLAELARHAPVHHDLLRLVVARRLAGDDEGADKLSRELPKAAIDYAVTEKTDQPLLIPARFHWIAVGSWSELHE